MGTLTGGYASPLLQEESGLTASEPSRWGDASRRAIGLDERPIVPTKHTEVEMSNVKEDDRGYSIAAGRLHV